MNQIVIDASHGVLGRIASYAAKQAMLGKSVIVVNCDHAMVTGRRRSIIEEYINIRQKGGSSLRGPYFPKHSDRVMKRTIRGMLDYTKQRGLDAFKRVRCYPNLPPEFQAAKKITFVRETKSKTMSLQELEKEI